MFSTPTLMTLIPALPLAGAGVTAVLGPRLLRQQSHWPVLAGIAASCVCSLMLLGRVADMQHAAHDRPGESHAVGVEVTHTLWTWAVVPGALDTPAAAHAPAAEGAPAAGPSTAPPSDAEFRVDVTLRADPLTAIMLPMVTFIAALVVLYASGYMHGDPGYWRFFSYVGLFVFSMTMLVSVSNFALLYVFWEAVGVCSYLLIGFWYEKPEAAAAGKKAFLVNRVGDFGFALGLFLIWTTYGTLNFHDTHAADGSLAVAGVLGQHRLASPALFVGGAVGLAIPLLLLVGACGKSAQFPLHVWLPDAMEGPTPVSALIHAATMVTAGVYMVTRCTPLYLVSVEAQMAVAAAGGISALLAGAIAVTQTDLKRVLAYSTISQLGFMFVGLGTGLLSGITGGMFHLFTHAFFKALLFLGAGSVMHAMGHVIDMRRFGGLRGVMPWTCRTFWFGALALAGVVPFAGFWSKDLILAAVHERAHGELGFYAVLYWGGLFTAFLTAFYTFRALFLTFYGPERIPHEAGHHAHESPPAMIVPLVILAACSLVVGAYFEWTHGFAHFLHATPSLAYEPARANYHGPEFHLDVAALSTLVAGAGIALAAYLYLGSRREVEWLARFFRTPLGLNLYQLSWGKFFFDPLYYALFVLPLKALAWLCYQADRWLVDGLVNACGRVPVGVGAAFRALQSGLVQFYALAMVLGTLILLGTLLVWPAT